MWSRITNVIKARPGTPALDAGDNVLSNNGQQSPNVSVFREEDSERIPSATLPTKNDKKNVFRRLSKVSNNENLDSFSRNTFPKKVLSSLKGGASRKSNVHCYQYYTDTLITHRTIIKPSFHR